MSTARRSMACLKLLVSDQVYIANNAHCVCGSLIPVLSLRLSLVSVGFEYESCPDLILWEKRTAVLQGYETTASKLGGWTIDKHHALNIQSGESALKPCFSALHSFIETPTQKIKIDFFFHRFVSQEILNFNTFLFHCNFLYYHSEIKRPVCHCSCFKICVSDGKKKTTECRSQISKQLFNLIYKHLYQSIF